VTGLYTITKIHEQLPTIMNYRDVAMIKEDIGRIYLSKGVKIAKE
jgi:hypothetical protein